MDLHKKPIKSYMNTRLFSFFIFLICVGIYTVYLQFQIEFSGNEELVVKIERLEYELQQQHAKSDIAQYELESFKQYVAVNLPTRIEGQSYSVRNIASLVTVSETKLIDKPKMDFAKIRENYLQHNYEAANTELKTFVETYTDSSYILEAYFLMANSYYKTKQYERSLSAINFLVKQYPESEMTGLGLLLMGDILETQERWDEARDIYNSIQKNFKFPELKEKAKQRLSGLKV